jgi:thymidylate synthase
VHRKLRDDPDTRQAVITLWDPALDRHDPQPKRDYPCTVMLHFMIRGGKLTLRVHMRSNDVWLGLPYDVFQFTQLQLTLARALGIEAGDYVHQASSLHLYERDLTAVSDLHPPAPDAQPYGACGFGHGEETSMAIVMSRAAAVAHGHELPNPTDSEKLYLDALRDDR